jgi:hypothetical protein
MLLVVFRASLFRVEVQICRRDLRVGKLSCSSSVILLWSTGGEQLNMTGLLSNMQSCPSTHWNFLLMWISV